MLLVVVLVAVHQPLLHDLSPSRVRLPHRTLIGAA